MPERPCCLSRTFSGFKSQWMRRLRCNSSRQNRIECANLRTNCNENPCAAIQLTKHNNTLYLKLVLLDQLIQVDRQQLECDALVISELEMIEHVHNVIAALQEVRALSRVTHSALTSTSCRFKCSSMRISSSACRWKRFSLRTSFNATYCWYLWSYALITCVRKEARKNSISLIQSHLPERAFADYLQHLIAIR